MCGVGVVFCGVGVGVGVGGVGGGFVGVGGVSSGGGGGGSCGDDVGVRVGDRNGQINGKIVTPGSGQWTHAGRYGSRSYSKITSQTYAPMLRTVCTTTAIAGTNIACITVKCKTLTQLYYCSYNNYNTY